MNLYESFKKSLKEGSWEDALRTGKVVNLGGKENYTPTDFKYDGDKVYYKNSALSGNTWAEHPNNIDKIIDHIKNSEAEGFKATVVDEETSVEPVDMNKVIDNDMTIKELDDTAQWLYDYDRDEWDKFTDNELIELAKLCQITPNSFGRAYDDEVFDEMDKRGLKLHESQEMKEADNVEYLVIMTVEEQPGVFTTKTYDKYDNAEQAEDKANELRAQGINCTVETLDKSFEPVDSKRLNAGIKFAESQSQEIEGIMKDLRKDIPNIDKYMEEYYAEIAKEEPRPSYDKEKDEMNPEWEKWNREKNNILYSEKAWDNFANWVKNKYNENINESEWLNEADNMNTTTSFIDIKEIIKYAENYLMEKLNTTASIVIRPDGQYTLTIPNTDKAVADYLKLHNDLHLWEADLGYKEKLGGDPEDYISDIQSIKDKLNELDPDKFATKLAYEVWEQFDDTCDYQIQSTKDRFLNESYNYIGTDTGEAGRSDKSHMEHTFTVYDCFGEVETFKSKEDAEKYIEEHKDDDLYTDPEYGCENGPEFRIEEDDIEVNNKKIVVKDDLAESEKVKESEKTLAVNSWTFSQ